MADGIQIVVGFLHTLVVIIWLGGAVFFDRIFQPSLKSLPPAQAGKLSQDIVKRFTPVAWASVIVILITGLLRASSTGMLKPEVLFGTAYGNVLLAKIVLFGVMVVNGLIITSIGLKLAKQPTLEYIARGQNKIKLISEANIILGVVVILLAVAMRIGV